jgi:hypothetical protein
MLQTYEAVLRGNRLEWEKDVPLKPDSEAELVVLVTILESEPRAPQQQDQGRRMAESLEKLAAIHPIATIRDPKAWEREMRQERQLPGRS